MEVATTITMNNKNNNTFALSSDYYGPSSSLLLLDVVVEYEKDIDTNNTNEKLYYEHPRRSSESVVVQRKQLQQFSHDRREQQQQERRRKHQQKHLVQSGRWITFYAILTIVSLPSSLVPPSSKLSFSRCSSSSFFYVEALFGPKSILGSSRTISSSSSSRSSSSSSSSSLLVSPITRIQQQQQQSPQTSSNTNSYTSQQQQQQHDVVDRTSSTTTNLHLSKQQTIEDNTTVPQQQERDEEEDELEISVSTQQQQQLDDITRVTPSLETSLATSTLSSIDPTNEVITSSSSSLTPTLSSSTTTTLFGGLSSRQIVLGATIGLLSLTIGFAEVGILPGSVPGVPYTNDEILYDCLLMILTSVLGWGFVKLNTSAVKYGIIEPRDARKIIHTFSAPLFMVLWPCYTMNIGARFFAAIVPTINAIRLYLASQTTIGQTDDIHTTEPSPLNSVSTATSSSSTTSSDSGDIIPVPTSEEYQLAVAISRTGDVKEALGGPFIYVIMLLSAVVLYWTDSVHGIMAMSCMAAGDGVADLLGRRYGKYTPKWTILGNSKKSIAGTIAFIIASTATATALIYWMHSFGYFVPTFTSLSTIDIIGRIVCISIITSILEVIPFQNGLDDNYIVPISAAILSMLLFP